MSNLKGVRVKVLPDLGQKWQKDLIFSIILLKSVSLKVKKMTMM